MNSSQEGMNVLNFNPSWPISEIGGYEFKNFIIQ